MPDPTCESRFKTTRHTARRGVPYRPAAGGLPHPACSYMQQMSVNPSFISTLNAILRYEIDPSGLRTV